MCFRVSTSQAGYIEIPNTTPTCGIRDNNPRGIAHAGQCRVLNWDDGVTFDWTVKNDTYVSVSNRGTPHFHCWHQLPGDTKTIGTPDGILLFPRGTYVHFQDCNIMLYLDMIKYYVKYE